MRTEKYIVRVSCEHEFVIDAECDWDAMTTAADAIVDDPDEYLIVEILEGGAD